MKDKPIDRTIKEIDKFYNNYWAHPQNKEPYSVLIEKLIQYKKAHQIQNLLLVLKNRIDSQETFLNLEKTAWTAIFVILGLFTTAISDLILAHHAELPLFNS